MTRACWVFFLEALSATRERAVDRNRTGERWGSPQLLRQILFGVFHLCYKIRTFFLLINKLFPNW